MNGDNTQKMCLEQPDYTSKEPLGQRRTLQAYLDHRWDIEVRVLRYRKRTSKAVKAISVSESARDIIRVGIVAASFTNCVLCDGSAAMALNLATISLALIVLQNTNNTSVTRFHKANCRTGKTH